MNFWGHSPAPHAEKSADFLLLTLVLQIWSVTLLILDGDETWQAERVMERIKFLAQEVHLEGENRR